MNKILSVVLQFVVLLAVQILVCNHVNLFGFINPYIYILAILLLPLDIPRPWQYIIAFFTGLTVDFFAMTYGVHASATLWVALARPYLVRRLNGGKTTEATERPVPGVKDFRWLLVYAFLLVFLHHFAITLLETFNFREFFRTLTVSFINALFTTTIVLCIEYIFFPLKKR